MVIITVSQYADGKQMGLRAFPYHRSSSQLLGTSTSPSARVPMEGVVEREFKTLSLDVEGAATVVDPAAGLGAVLTFGPQPRDPGAVVPEASEAGGGEIDFVEPRHALVVVVVVVVVPVLRPSLPKFGAGAAAETTVVERRGIGTRVSRRRMIWTLRRGSWSIIWASSLYTAAS